MPGSRSSLFFQAEDGIRDYKVTGVQTCALPIWTLPRTYALVSSGGYHTCGLTLDGVAYCWGDNTAWQLGTGGDKSTRGTPTPVAGGLHFASLGAGGFPTCALTAAGAADCWGGGRDSGPQVAGGLSFVLLAAGGPN